MTIPVSLLSALRAAVGEEYVLTDDEPVEPYSRDECQHLAAMPDVVVRPNSTEEVAAVLRRASENDVPVTPRGAGTGKHGAAIPVHGGIVLCLERMDRILEIDIENSFAIVEPGVITETLQEIGPQLVRPEGAAPLDEVIEGFPGLFGLAFAFQDRRL